MYCVSLDLPINALPGNQVFIQCRKTATLIETRKQCFFSGFYSPSLCTCRIKKKKIYVEFIIFNIFIVWSKFNRKLENWVTTIVSSRLPPVLPRPPGTDSSTNTINNTTVRPLTRCQTANCNILTTCTTAYAATTCDESVASFATRQVGRVPLWLLFQSFSQPITFQSLIFIRLIIFKDSHGLSLL